MPYAQTHKQQGHREINPREISRHSLSVVLAKHWYFLAHNYMPLRYLPKLPKKPCCVYKAMKRSAYRQRRPPGQPLRRQTPRRICQTRARPHTASDHTTSTQIRQKLQALRGTTNNHHMPACMQLKLVYAVCSKDNSNESKKNVPAAGSRQGVQTRFSCLCSSSLRPLRSARRSRCRAQAADRPRSGPRSPERPRPRRRPPGRSPLTSLGPHLR